MNIGIPTSKILLEIKPQDVWMYHQHLHHLHDVYSSRIQSCMLSFTHYVFLTGQSLRVLNVKKYKYWANRRR